MLKYNFIQHSKLIQKLISVQHRIQCNSTLGFQATLHTNKHLINCPGKFSAQVTNQPAYPHANHETTTMKTNG